MKKKKISLKPEKKFEEHPFLTKFLSFVVGTGKVIIIGTEFLTLGVFLARFKLDRDISDLSGALENKQAILETTKDFEKDFRLLQDRLALLKKVQSKEKFSETLEEFRKKWPQEAYLSTLRLKEKEISLTATAESGEAFARLIAELLDWEDLAQITLTASSFDPEKEEFHFALALELAHGSQ